MKGVGYFNTVDSDQTISDFLAQKAQTDLGAIAAGPSTPGVSPLEAAQLAEAQQVTAATTAVQAAQNGSEVDALGKRHLLQVNLQLKAIPDVFPYKCTLARPL